MEIKEKIQKYKQSLAALRGPAQTLFLFGACAAMANAGTISFTDFTATGWAIMAVGLSIAAAVVVLGLAFAIFNFIGGNWERGLGTVAGTIVGAIVIGYATSWAASLTGQTIG